MDIERIYTVPLRDLKGIQRPKRAPRAIAVIKRFVAKHMKSTEKDVWIDTHVNERLWERGIERPPSRIKIKAVKFEDQNIVEVSLPEE